jgi:hypothetical protein
MKQLLNGIAIITHPIFLPFFSLLIYYPLVATYSIGTLPLLIGWLTFAYIILPLVYFVKVRKINLAQPNLDERRSIFRAYSLVNFGFAIVNIFLVQDYIYFYLAACLLHILLLGIAFIELKASWHTAIWSFLLGTGLMMLYQFKRAGTNDDLLLEALKLLGIILLIVCFVRWKSKAHTPFELLMGIVIGFLASTPLLF